MEYGVFQINADGFLVFIAKYASKGDAIAHAKTGANMVVLDIYL